MGTDDFDVFQILGHGQGRRSGFKSGGGGGGTEDQFIYTYMYA